MISLAVTLAERVSLAILGRRHADMANKGAAQRVRVGEAALYRHLLGRVASRLQEPPRSGDARGFHRRSRRHPHLTSKQPREMAQAQTRACGELVDTVI